MGVAISGLTSDARVLSRYMRNECLNHKFVFDSPMVPGRLVRQLADSLSFLFSFLLFLSLFLFLSLSFSSLSLFSLSLFLSLSLSLSFSLGF